MKSFTQLKKETLASPRVKAEYDRLGPEFEVISMIIKRRIEKNITQAELANRIGTKQSAISRLESGDYNPSLEFLGKVAQGLGARLRISFQDARA